MINKTRKILEVLESHGENGCGVITLSLETGYSQAALRSFFRKHKKYCIPLNGKTTFKLNRSAMERGSVVKMVESIERKSVNDRVASAFSLGLAFGMCIANIDVFVELLF